MQCYIAIHSLLRITMQSASKSQTRFDANVLHRSAPHFQFCLRPYCAAVHSAWPTWFQWHCIPTHTHIQSHVSAETIGACAVQWLLWPLVGRYKHLIIMLVTFMLLLIK